MDNKVARPQGARQDLSTAYAAMAADEARKAEAEAWMEGLLVDTIQELDRGH